MERNVNFVLIGGIFLAIIVAMVAFIFWIGGKYLDEEKYQEYVVYSPESISGLSMGSAVRYKGILVGKIKSIGFKKGDMEKIEIRLNILSEIKLKEGACVMPESQGLAGTTFLQVIQGSGEILKNKNELCYEKGFIGKLFEDVQTSGEDVKKIIVGIKKILDDQNSNNIREIIASLKDVTKNLEQTRKNIDALSMSTKEAIDEINLGVKRGDYNLRAIVSPAMLGLESTIGEINRFFSKANFLLDRLEKSPYDTLFGQRKQKQENQ
ncbi:MCE family protein [Helicobacter cholecystus]|uniref:MCE family protein n=1 Tax=Helicobacter cholecystus TaxID=45498 RepID=A0A3D8IY66_9HELI|nr:MlaD family protein [Helicobacter cholecystus]RDU69993.1 MCE family protein [Helicobacter cholecystus]VEJ24837.1 ABC transport system substrate binding protein [Helicobacter cholecystus]